MHVLAQTGVEDSDVVTMPFEVPGDAETDSTGTNNGNGAVQLSASAGITSEYASKLAARLP